MASVRYLAAVLTGVLIGVSSARAQVIVDLSVPGSAGSATVYAGPQANANAGFAMTRGDLNGDVNRADLLIGAPGAGPAAQGQVFGMFMGPLHPGTVGLSSVADVIFTGESAGDGFGSAIAVGPVTHSTDVPRDVLVGAPNAYGGAGAVYLFPGVFSGGQSFQASSALLRVKGAPGDHLGSVVALGDINGDGYRDLLLLAPSKLYVIYGGSSLAGAWDLSTRSADFTIALPAPAVSLATGDWNNDGNADIAIGAPGVGGGAGAVYVYNGGSSLAAPSAVFTGIDAGDHAGFALDSADFDRNGVSDLIVGAPDAAGPANTRIGAGEVYVLYGGSKFPGSGSFTAAGTTIFGAGAGHHTGTAIAHGHIARNIEDDLLLLSPGASTAGDIDVVYGGAYALVSGQADLASQVGRVLRGSASAGPIQSVVAVDITGEGAEDIVAGVPAAANGGTSGAGLAFGAYSPSFRNVSSALSFTVAQGASQSVTFSVGNTGTDTISWMLRTNSSWLTASPTQGASTYAAPGQVTLTATPGALGVGTFHGSFALVSLGNNLAEAITIPVDLSVTPGTPTGPTYRNPFGVPDPPDEGSPDGVWTSTGRYVSVLPVKDVLVTFSNVTAAGRTTVQIVPNIQSPVGVTPGLWSYNISTTATFSGPVTVGLAYDPAELSGDDPLVRLWNGTSNVTTRVDGQRHLVFGTINGLPATVTAVYDPRGVTVGNDNGFSYMGAAMTGRTVQGWNVIPFNFDGDGASDFFLYNPANGRWKVMQNNSLGVFRASEGLWAPGWTVTAIDLDKDGYDDLFLYNPSSGAWLKALNDQHGGFTSQSGQWSPGWTVTPLDLNGDGRTDLFLYNPANGLWFRVLNQPDGSFAYASGQWDGGWTIVRGDLNGDGLTDLFLYNPSSGAWFEAFNASTGAFTYSGGVWSAGWTILPADFNADHITDLFLYNSASGLAFRVMNNGAPGGFTYASEQWSGGWTVQTADFNGDGRTDLFLHNPANGMWFKVLIGPGGGFTYVGGQWTSGWSATVADLDGDGHSDVWLVSPRGDSWFSATAGPTGPGGVSIATPPPAGPGPTGVMVDSSTGNLTSGWTTGWQTTPLHLQGPSHPADDLLIYSPASGQAYQAWNDGAGYLTYSALTLPAGAQILAVDFNNDGFDDLFAYNRTTGAWTKARNDQHGGFVQQTGVWDAGWIVTPIDLNGDGRVDLFAYNPDNGRWFRIINEVTDTFSYTGGAWSSGWTITPGDLNGDGLADLFLYNPANGLWFEALNTPGGGFTYVGGQWDPGWTVQAADFNADGVTDLFIYNPVSGLSFRVMNNGTGAFAYIGEQWSAGWAVTTLDLNGDGRTDLFLNNSTTGLWFNVITGPTGAFTYDPGQSSPGWTATAMRLNADVRDDVFLYNPRTGKWVGMLTP